MGESEYILFLFEKKNFTEKNVKKLVDSLKKRFGLKEEEINNALIDPHKLGWRLSFEFNHLFEEFKKWKYPLESRFTVGSGGKNYQKVSDKYLVFGMSIDPSDYDDFNRRKQILFWKVITDTAKIAFEIFDGYIGACGNELEFQDEYLEPKLKNYVFRMNFFGRKRVKEIGEEKILRLKLRAPKVIIEKLENGYLVSNGPVPPGDDP